MILTRMPFKKQQQRILQVILLVSSCSRALILRTAADSDATATRLDDCPPGSFHVQSRTKPSFCMLCPPNSYQDQFGKNYCLGCTSSIYNGTGSNFYLLPSPRDNDSQPKKMCVLKQTNSTIALTPTTRMTVTEEPSISPYLSPSKSSSDGAGIQDHSQLDATPATPQKDEDIDSDDTKSEHPPPTLNVVTVFLVIVATIVIFLVFTVFFCYNNMAIRPDKGKKGEGKNHQSQNGKGKKNSNVHYDSTLFNPKRNILFWEGATMKDGENHEAIDIDNDDISRWASSTTSSGYSDSV